MQTTLPTFAKPEFEVIRQHEEFVWLYERYAENDDYAGFIVCLHAQQLPRVIFLADPALPP